MKLLNLAPEKVWSVYYCQVGYEVSNLEVQNQLDFINKMNILKGKFCVLWIDIVPGTFQSQFSP